MKIVVRGHSIDSDPSLIMGFILLAVLLNTYLFGVVSQQFYSYWSSGFKDSKCVKVFVIIQFVVIVFQGIALWRLAWSIFITNYGLPLNPPACTWEYLTQSVCGSVLVQSANVFLAIRIHSLTTSRLQSGLVLVFSTSAFVVAIVTTVMTCDSSLASSFLATLCVSTTQNAISAVWHGLQAVAQCLIMVFLARALLKSRSGLQKSDSVVNHLIRQVIQAGLLATLWVIAGLATWFLLPRTSNYVFFDPTAGPMYTHAIYDTLLSRVRLRERMGDIEIMSFPESQEKPDINGGQWEPSVSNDAVSVITLNLSSTISNSRHTPRRGGTFEHDESETTCCRIAGCSL